MTDAFYGLGSFVVKEAEICLASADLGLVYNTEKRKERGRRGRQSAVEKKEDNFEETELLSEDLFSPKRRIARLLTY